MHVRLCCVLLTAALRLLRRLIGLKDEFYNRYIVKNDLLRPVIDAFVTNGHRYNLFNSAVIELFEFVRSVSMLSIIWSPHRFDFCAIHAQILSC